MQIVIDISEVFYEYCKAQEDAIEIQLAVKKGTPLPKGHGRLIDGDELESRMKIGYCIVKNAPTIIEADVAESEEEE